MGFARMGRQAQLSFLGEDRPASPPPRLGPSERELIALCAALGARSVAGWSPAEEALAGGLPLPALPALDEVRGRIAAGDDPLGERFCRLRSADERRGRGATYTPPGIVRAMLDRAAGHATPARVVDPGVGSGRFLVAAGRRFPGAALVGVDLDPLAVLLARAHLAAAGLAGRARVVLGDYRDLALDPIAGPTLFLGNPPYVRHHQIEPEWKSWLTRKARQLGLPASQLAGLHVHFFLATALKAQPGDFGAFVTAAEWLDVNYGGLVRDLFLGHLGGQRLTLIEPTAAPFPDAATTAVVAHFAIGSRPDSISLARAATLDELPKPADEHVVPREWLADERRWSHLTRPARKGPAGFVELGELCRVHRGQVTGANKVWIAGKHSEGLPARTLLPTVTKARELFAAGRELADPAPLRRVIDLPVDLDGFDAAERQAIDRFLAEAERLGVPGGYVAANRRAWWSVGLHRPAPILATYMARRPPAFVLNRADARHINIAHGLYPREPLGDAALRGLVEYLAASARTDDGRTYAGGLTKFEPREMERIPVPGLDQLRGSARVRAPAGVLVG